MLETIRRLRREGWIHAHPHRRAYRVLGQYRTRERYEALPAPDQEPLATAVVRLASQYRRYGYQRITRLPSAEGLVSQIQAGGERNYRREELKVLQKQPKRRWLWLNDRLCIWRRPSWRHHIWACHFVHARTHGEWVNRMLMVIGEYSRESGDRSRPAHQVRRRPADPS